MDDTDQMPLGFNISGFSSIPILRGSRVAYLFPGHQVTGHGSDI